MRLLVLIIFGLLSFSQCVFGQDLIIDRSSDGSYSFEIYRTTINEGSSLNREAILINDQSCPIQLNSQSFKVDYEDRNFYWVGNTNINVSEKITGLKITHMVYDAFGQHVKTLSNSEVKDFSEGLIDLEAATWRAYDSEATEMLTHVSFVTRVRYADGSQWVYNKSAVIEELVNLNLEEIADIETEE